TALGRNRAPEEKQKELGRYDRLGDKAAEAIPDAKLVELEGIGHVPQYEAYDDYIEALTDFLSAQR
ncbi:MAG TPA: alpha/beta hydrolase, partial [Alcanivorax sp.]|nr:alpha/beta hydrolase [Alcanivorax sp.]